MNKLQKTMEVFRERGFEVSYHETKELAVEYLKQKIDNTTVAFGGTQTQLDIGLYPALAENNLVAWNYCVKSEDIRILSRHCRVYVTSVNAITESGELINIDNRGNRIAASLYGHEKVYFIVGKNKLTPNLPSGLWRAKNIAAPKNAQRLRRKTPCAVAADKCYNCDSPERICRAVCIIDHKPVGAAYEIVFVNEDLGL